VAECSGYEVALEFHLVLEIQHVAAFLVGDGDRVLGERAGDLFQRQAVLAGLDKRCSSRACSPGSRSSKVISSPSSRPARSS
jgi:hypothetical protein